MCASGYRSPATCAAGTAASIRASWSSSIATSTAPSDSTNLVRVRAPISGTTSVPRDATQAIAACATDTPRVGPITLDCEVLATTDGQRLVVLTPPAGSSALENLRLLAVLRDQALGTETAPGTR